MKALKRFSALAAAAVAWACVATAPAAATGTITITRGNGTSSYGDVEIKVFAGTMFLTSDDGDGTIVITKAACSFQGKVMVCLPSAATLVQDGESSALALRNGTVYINDTDQVQPLLLSSRKMPAHSVMVSFTTKGGTYVNAVGAIDEVVR